MKKISKGKWFLATIVAVAVTALLVFLYFKGFRITYAPDLENSWDAISAFAAWAGAIGTVMVLWYNHRAIKLTQCSVQQAIGLQLYDKRLELYSALSEDTAFEQVPMSLKIVYSEEIYNLYAEVSKLCNERSRFIHVLYELQHKVVLCEVPCWNVCESIFQRYLKDMESVIKLNPSREEVLIKQKTAAEELHQKICHQYIILESKMKKILEESINIEA